MNMDRFRVGTKRSRHDDRADGFTTSTAGTRPRSIVAAALKVRNSIKYLNSFIVPWPGSTFIIRCSSSGRVITLLDGEVEFTELGGLGSPHWICVKRDGWLGFRNLVSGRFLGYSSHGKLICTAREHRKAQNFCTRMRPQGGCVLLMQDDNKLSYVGINFEEGTEQLEVDWNGECEEIAWEFDQVEGPE